MSKHKTTAPFLAIQAGLNAIRGKVIGEPEAIDKAVGKVISVGTKVSKPTDGTTSTGRFTGLHIMEFQDRLYGHNMLPGWGFTDVELAVAWRAEFPTAKCNFAIKHAYVTSARNDLNRGRRGLTVTQLNAQFGFDGPVGRFHPKPVEEVKVKRVKAAPKAQAAEPVQPVEPPAEIVFETATPQ